MTKLNVCKKVVELGGEIFCHASPVITEERVNVYEFMYDYFVGRKQYLESQGFKVRGLIKAGGTDAISGNDTILGWLRKYYDYSDFNGTYAEVYPHLAKTRWSISNGGSLSTIKSKINECETNKTWVSAFFHTLDGTEGIMTESVLREFLDYVASKNIEVLAYSTAHDKYASTKLEEMIKALN